MLLRLHYYISMIVDRFKATISLISQLSVLMLVIATPLVVWNQMTDLFELPKFLILLLVTLLLLVSASLTLLADGRLTISRTPLDLPLVMLLVVSIISTFFAQAKWVSILGNFPHLNNSLIFMTTLTLFYFILAAHLKKVSFVKQLPLALLFTGVLVSVVSLLSYFGIPLPFSFAKLQNFTPTGSAFSTTAYLALLLPLPVLELLKPNTDKSLVQEVNNLFPLNAIKPLWAMILGLFLVVIVVIGSSPTYIAAFIAVALTLMSLPQNDVKKSYLYLMVPVASVILVAVLSFVKLPDTINPLYSRAQSYQRELQLSFVTSWKISVSSFRDAPFWGTGPASYLFDFSTYKPLEFNNTSLWNRRFDTAANEYLGVLATLGGAGFIALLLATVIFVSMAFKALVWPNTEEGHTLSLGRFLAVSGITFFVLLALHSSTLVLWIIGIVILASFMSLFKKTSSLSVLSSLPSGHDASQALESIPGIILMLVLILSAFLLFYTGRFVIADFHHRQALNNVSRGAGIDAYNSLVKAETLNPYVDLYRTDLAQTNFALANTIASGRASGTSSATLSDQDKQNIQTLLSQAISEARKATELSPNNPLNWEILGSIYRQIAGVAQNALIFALDSYGRAIQKDPLNPLLRLNAGGIYYSVKNYDLAIRLFSDSIALKGDYANGYYNLAVALKDKGEIKGAIVAAEKVISLVDNKSEDYRVANNLLTELKSKDQAASNTEAPAAKTSSALDKKDLPKVLNLPKPDKIATPEAVKKE